MKELYEKVVMEIVEFETADIITSSYPGEEDDIGAGFPSDESVG